MDTEQNDGSASTLPDFQAGVDYEVQMSRAVEFPPGSGNFLRPDQSVTLEGSWAELMKDAISDARAIPGPA